MSNLAHNQRLQSVFAQVISSCTKTDLCGYCLSLLTGHRRCGSFFLQDSVEPHGSWKRKKKKHYRELFKMLKEQACLVFQDTRFTFSSKSDYWGSKRTMNNLVEYENPNI